MHDIIIGLLGERRPRVEFHKRLSRKIRAQMGNAVCLPFIVESRYLKNTVACMRLMDIAALVLLGGHQKRIMRHLTHLTPSARKERSVNLITRRGKTFVGHHAKTIDDLVHILGTAKKI